jgi:hypothetical protein
MEDEGPEDVPQTPNGGALISWQGVFSKLAAATNVVRTLSRLIFGVTGVPTAWLGAQTE